MERARSAWVAFLCLLFIAGSASAKGTHDSEYGWYAGVGAEFTHYDLTVANVNSYVYFLENRGDTRVDTAATGFSIFGGFRHNRFIAIEIGYADFGTMSYHLGYRVSGVITYCGPTPCTSSPRVAPTDYEIRLSGPFVRARPALPIGSRFKIEGRVGWDFTQFDSTGGSDRTRFGSPGLSLGAGVLFLITPQLRAGLGWDKFQTIERPYAYAGSGRYVGATFYENDVDFRALALTLDFRF